MNCATTHPQTDVQRAGGGPAAAKHHRDMMRPLQVERPRPRDYRLDVQAVRVQTTAQTRRSQRAPHLPAAPVATTRRLRRSTFSARDRTFLKP
jgi:hypothetical protein